ncbi:MAG: hypothetical protein J7M25_10105, partial [Deltaproteobacteria bacterium]|nr:hypothetical protein [Deltaproteobacteria bacterium]
MLNTINLLASGFLATATVAAFSRRRSLAAAKALLSAKSSQAPQPIRVTWNGLFAGLVASVVIVSFVSIILLELGLFRLTLLEAIVGSLNVVSATWLVWIMMPAISRRAEATVVTTPSAVHFDWTELTPTSLGILAAILIISATALRFPLSRYSYGGQDQGSYVVSSRLFARTGRVVQHINLLARTQRDASLAPLRSNGSFFNPTSGLAVPGRYEGGLYPGFYISSRSEGLVVPQFFHLHPIWMSIMGWLWGPQNSVWSLILFALMGLWALWILSVRALDEPIAGFIVVAAMGINILQIWTSRYPLSEIPYQAFWLSGLALMAMVRPRDPDEGWLALVGGMAVAAIFFTRISSLFWLPVLVVSYLTVPIRNIDSRAHRIFHLTALTGAAWGLAHAYALSYPYVYDLVRKMLHVRLTAPLGWFLVTELSILGTIVLLKEGVVDQLLAAPAKRFVALLHHHRGVLAAVATLAVAAVLGWSLITKPVTTVLQGRHAILRIVQLAAFVSWPGVILGLAGMGLLLARAPRRVGRLLGFAGLWFALPILLKPPYNGYAYYYSRYYVSELLPIVFLGFAWVIPWTFANIDAHRRFGRQGTAARAFEAGVQFFVVAAGAYVLFFSLRGHFTNPTYRTEEMPGAWATMDAISDAIPRNAVVVINNRQPKVSGFHIMAVVPLQFAYGRDTFLGRRIGGLPNALFRIGHPVYLLEIAEHARPGCSHGRAFRLLRQGSFVYRHSEKTLWPPDQISIGRYLYRLYRVTKDDNCLGKTASQASNGSKSPSSLGRSENPVERHSKSRHRARSHHHARLRHPGRPTNHGISHAQPHHRPRTRHRSAARHRSA